MVQRKVAPKPQDLTVSGNAIQEWVDQFKPKINDELTSALRNIVGQAIAQVRAPLKAEARAAEGFRASYTKFAEQLGLAMHDEDGIELSDETLMETFKAHQKKREAELGEGSTLTVTKLERKVAALERKLAGALKRLGKYEKVPATKGTKAKSK